jgi:serine phosphatase RsbU (regulator of sigma subunit)
MALFRESLKINGCDFDDKKTDVKFMLPWMISNEKIDEIGIVDLSGNEINIIRIDDDHFVFQYSESHSGILIETPIFAFESDNFAYSEKVIKSNKGFNKNSVWFKEALKLDYNEVGQSSTHTLENFNEPGISFLTRFKSDEGNEFIVRFSYRLLNFSLFTSQYKPSENGFIMVLNDQMHFVGVPNINPFINNAEAVQNFTCRNANELNNTLIDDILNVDEIQNFRNLKNDTLLRVETSDVYFLFIKKIGLGNLISVTVIPQSDIISSLPYIRVLHFLNYFIIALLSLVILYFIRNISKSNFLISRQKEVIQEQNKQVADSFEYAKGIQDAILPDKNWLNRVFSDFVVVHSARDTIGGDFYWAHRMKLKIGGETTTIKIIVVADSTGHGVPGALISIMGSWMLNEIIVEKEIYNPAYILNEIDKRFKKINKYKGKNKTHDSMDLSIVVLDEADNKLYFAGSNTSIYLMNENNSEEIKGNTLLAGIGYLPEGTSFTTHQRSINNNSRVYMYTDGIRDQFGGERNKKFGSGSFRKMLKETIGLSIKEQVSQIWQKVQKWKGDLPQTDDITLVAFSPKDCNETSVIRVDVHQPEISYTFVDCIAELSLKGDIVVDQFDLILDNGINNISLSKPEYFLLDLKYLQGSDYRKINTVFEEISGRIKELEIKKIAIIIPLDLFSKASLIRISTPYKKYGNLNFRFFSKKKKAFEWLTEKPVESLAFQ